MSYLQLRFTGSFYDDPSHNFTKRQIIKNIKDNYLVDKFIYVEEKNNKMGEETTPHIHFHGYTDKDVKKDSLQKFIRRLGEKYGYTIKGNKCYAVNILGDPDDEERWYRYCLKEEGAKVAFKGFEKEELKKMRILAQEERKLQIERNKKAHSAYLDKSTFKGKMFDFFKKEGVASHRPFIIGMIKYYLEKGKVAPFSKFNDYWIDYQISTGLMTPEEYYDKVYS